MHCSMLQCVAVCCSVLQYVAVCCRCADVHAHVSMCGTHSCTPHMCVAWHTCALRGIRVHIRFVCVASAHVNICIVCVASVYQQIYTSALCVCHQHISKSIHLYIYIVCVPSAHLYGVSFAKEPYERDDILHIYTSLLTCAHLRVSRIT